MSSSANPSSLRPSIRIVSDEADVAARVKRTLGKGKYKVASAVSIQDLENNGQESGGGVIVVITKSLPRSGSLFDRIHELYPQSRLIACLAPTRLRGIRFAIDHGVDGFVWEDELERTLEPTIRAVWAGQLVVPRDSYHPIDSTELTNREKQTLSLVIMGLTNQEIADKLFLSEATVKSHLNKAYRKLGVRSRAEATRLIADPAEGLGIGILAITGPGHARGLTRKR